MNLPHDPQIAAWLAADPAEGSPEPLARALAATRQTRKRPRWTFPERWLPVQLTMARTPSLRPILAIVLVALLTLALVATALFIGSQRRAVPPPFGLARNGAIVYAQDGDLFVADELDGTPRPLVSGPDVDSDPVFSRQGDRIAFLRSVQDETGGIDPLEDMLMTVRPDGSDVTELGMLGSIASFDWSPDGSALLVMRYAHGGDGIDGTPALKVTQSDGSGSRTLDVEGRPASGSWRPDGRHIAFVGTRGGSTAYIADADGTNVRTLPIGPARDLAWSPDGSHLAFLAMAETTGIGIAEIDEEGAVSGLRHLGLDDRSTPWTDAKWSPDGSQFAFLLKSDSALGVGIANADGSGFRFIGDEVREHRAIDLTWAPDGRSLVIFDHPTDMETPFVPGAKAWSVDVATGEQTEVQNPVWSWQRVTP